MKDEIPLDEEAFELFRTYVYSLTQQQLRVALRYSRHVFQSWALAVYCQALQNKLQNGGQ